MTFRKDLLPWLAEPRTISSLARLLGLTRKDVEEDIRHLIRSARSAGHTVTIVPAKCRACGFVFPSDKLSKPGKCPSCKKTWIYEAMVQISTDATS